MSCPLVTYCCCLDVIVRESCNRDTAAQTPTPKTTEGDEERQHGNKAPHKAQMYSYSLTCSFPVLPALLWPDPRLGWGPKAHTPLHQRVQLHPPSITPSQPTEPGYVLTRQERKHSCKEITNKEDRAQDPLQGTGGRRKANLPLPAPTGGWPGSPS